MEEPFTFIISVVEKLELFKFKPFFFHWAILMQVHSYHEMFKYVIELSPGVAIYFCLALDEQDHVDTTWAQDRKCHVKKEYYVIFNLNSKLLTFAYVDTFRIWKLFCVLSYHLYRKPLWVDVSQLTSTVYKTRL